MTFFNASNLEFHITLLLLGTDPSRSSIAPALVTFSIQRKTSDMQDSTYARHIHNLQ